MPCDISGHAAFSSDATGLCTSGSGMAPIALAPASEDLVALAVAPSIFVISVAVVANRSPPLTPSAVVVDSSTNRQAPEDSRTEFAGMVSTPGIAPGCSLVWMEGFRSFVRLVLHQICSSITATIKIGQQPTPRQGYLHVGFPVDGSKPALPS